LSSPTHRAPDGPLRVLLVEDDDDHADLVLGLLETVRRPSIEAVRAATVRAALDVLGRGRVDAVLLDQKLPDSEFWETVPRVVEAAPRLPVLVLTSLNDLDLALEAVNQGAQDYLVKSELTADGLLRALRYAVERKRYAAAAEQSQAVMTLFAHAVAHEIKAPLGAARLHLTLVRQDGEDGGLPAPSAHHLARAEEMVVRAGALIQDLLRFGVGPSSVPVNVAEVVREALDELEPELRETAARVAVGELPTLLADRTKLRQLFVNLLANALKYRDDARPPHVRVGAEREAAAWCFIVSDNGVGMEPEDVERVFGLFQRAHDPQRYPGSGLGLALCRQIVEGHGGRIWAESEVGAGTAIKFTLPDVPSGTAPARVPESAAEERA
jgi:two-component system sensor histidine kinase/response regulator